MEKIFLSQPKVSSSELETLRVGDSVKVLINGKERVWVEVTEVTNSSPKNFKGKIDVDPNLLEDVKFGDAVSFGAESVIDVLRN
jgi:hypothetical protein